MMRLWIILSAREASGNIFLCWDFNFVYIQNVSNHVKSMCESAAKQKTFNPPYERNSVTHRMQILI